MASAPTPRTLPESRVGDPARLNSALDRLEALPIVVPPVKLDENYNIGRVIVNITCRRTHNETRMKQPFVSLNKKPADDPKAVPSFDVAAEKLFNELETEHAGCIEEQIRRVRAAFEGAQAAPLQGIQSLYSFFMLGGDGQLLARTYSCWCPACSRVRSRSSFAAGFGGAFNVPGCLRSKLTLWRSKPRLTSTAADGIASEREYAKDLWTKTLRSQVAPTKFAAVQADALWSESERRHLRPGHFWMCELGDAGGGKGSFEQGPFKLAPRSWKEYLGTRFYDGEAALNVKRWFHRCPDDASGRKFVAWDPKKDAAPGAPPVALLFNSSKLRGVLGPREFQKRTALGLGVGATTRGATVRELEGGDTWFMLQEDADDQVRDRCIAAGSVLC